MAEVLEIHSAKLFNSVTIWLKLKKESIMHDTRFCIAFCHYGTVQIKKY